MLSLRNLSVLATFISSMISQKRSTTSCMVFSQTPCWEIRTPNKIFLSNDPYKLTLLQNPVMQGVPSGRTSGGSTGKQVSLMLMRQQRLQASAMMSHMQLCRPWVSQYGTHFPFRHCPRSWQIVPSAMAGDLGHSAWAPVQRASCSQVAY